MQRIDFQCVFECIDRLRKLFGLHIGGAEEIPRISVVGIDLEDMLELVNRRLRIASILREQSEAVPRIRALGILLERVFQRGLRVVDFLKIQIRYALVQTRDGKLGIDFGRLLELLQSLIEQLLVHVGDADVVEARSFDWVRLRREGKQTKSRDKRGDKTCRNFQIHSVKDLTTDDMRAHSGFR